MSSQCSALLQLVVMISQTQTSAIPYNKVIPENIQNEDAREPGESWQVNTTLCTCSTAVVL